MPYEIILAPEAVEDLRSLRADVRSKDDLFDYQLENHPRFLQRNVITT